MSAALPTESAVDNAVNTFGLGTYDSEGDEESSHGEDANEKSTRKTLPDGGGPDVQNPDRLMSYPDEHPVLGGILTGDQDFLSKEIVTNDGRILSVGDYVIEISNMIRGASGMLPGDVDSDDGRGHNHGETIEDPVLTTSQSELPNDAENPVARSDYFDKTVVGQSSDLWADDDSGVYADDHTSESELPGVLKNETTMDDFLGALGNAWSGYTTEDVSGPNGFPSTDHSENSDYPRSDDESGGRLVAFTKVETMNEFKTANDVLIAFDRGDISIGKVFDILRGINTHTRTSTGSTVGELIDKAMAPSESAVLNKTATSRQATDFVKVGGLTEEVLKEYGKKNLTKRQILAFLQKHGEPQFLSSDIIRCLKHRHEVYVKDVLDEFPVAKLASTNFASVRDRVIALEVSHIREPDVSSILRRSAAALTNAITVIERLEVHG